MKNLLSLLSISAILIGVGSANMLSGVAWQGPVDVFSTQYAQKPVVGVDAAGNAVIAAITSDDLSTFYEEGAQLVQGVVQNTHRYQLITLAGDNNINAIAVNAAGNGALLWTEFDNGTFNDIVRGAVLTNNSWGSATTLSDPVTENVVSFFQTGITLDDDTKAIGAWSGQILSDLLIRISQYVSPSWSAPQSLASSATDILSGVAISGSPSGQALLAWSDGGGVYTLNGSYYDGVTWNTQPVSTDLFNTCVPLIAVSMNASNQAMLLWQNNSDFGISSSLFFGGTYGSQQSVYVPAVGETLVDVATALDNAGNALALWITFDVSDTYKVLASRYTGGSWGAAVPLATTDAGNSLNHPNIGVDKLGNAYAVWEKDDNSSNGQVYFSQYTQATNSWLGTPQLLSTIGSSSKYPHLSMNEFGGAAVVWAVDPLATETIQVVYTANTILNPPQNLTGRQIYNSFLTQADIIDELKWSASSSPGIVAYNIWRDGLQIAVVQANAPLAYQDHNLQKGKLYTYQVIAVDGNGALSTPATISLP